MHLKLPILLRLFFNILDFLEHVAQSVEHLTFNEVVVGSIPTVLTTIFFMKIDFIIVKMIFIFLLVVGIALGFVIKNISKSSSENQLHIQITKIQQQIDSFYTKYQALPGDISNAFELKLSNYPTNGNADGIITDSIIGNTLFDGEIANFWLHLGNFKMFSETYDGFSNESARIGFSMPKALGISENNQAGIIAFGKLINHQKTNFLHLGFSEADATQLYTKPVLSAAKAHDLDKKFDDGLPNSGKILAKTGQTLNDNSGQESCLQNSKYLVSNQISCQLLFSF